MSHFQISKILQIVLFIIFLKDSCHGNPFAGLFDPKCVVIQGDCPHENVTFWLYTNQTHDSPLKLDPLNLSPDLLQPSKPLYIVLHGYTGDRDFSPNSHIRPALLETRDVYVISVDYGPLVPYPCYFSAVENLPLASKCLGQLINNMVDQNIVENDNIHMIGFSLGAQVAGQTANYLKRRLKRITGMNVAKFEENMHRIKDVLLLFRSYFLERKYQTHDSPLKLDPLNLSPDLLQPSKPLYIVLHGYTGDRDFSPNSHIRPALLETRDVYVISVDYGPLVPYPCYFSAVENLPLASKCLGQLINNMVDQNIVENDNIHMIGFSLGAQVAGQTANYLKRRLKRITGLDPAKPMFVTVSSDRKLDATDAEFVDVIHTDVLGRGMLRSMGHADFYPNMGPHQPGCKDENMDDPGSCNHDRAPRYYAESIRNPEGFWAYSCPSWLHNIFGLCDQHTNDEVMGHSVSKRATGSFFLNTRDSSPYAMGKRIPQTIKGRLQPELYDYNDIYDGDFEPQLRKAFVDWTDYNFEEFRKMTHFDERHAMMATAMARREH